MKPPETPLMDAIAPALRDWQEANVGRPVLALDPDTYNAFHPASPSTRQIAPVQ